MNKHLISLNYIKYAYAKKIYNINATFTFPLVICFVLVLSLNKFKKAFKKSIKINFSNKHMAYLKIKNI